MPHCLKASLSAVAFSILLSFFFFAFFFFAPNTGMGCIFPFVTKNVTKNLYLLFCAHLATVGTRSRIAGEKKDDFFLNPTVCTHPLHPKSEFHTCLEYQYLDFSKYFFFLVLS